jgi:hypothetical protein
MIRFLQERVNKATKEYDGLPGETKATDDSKAAAGALSGKQGRVRDLTRKLASKLDKDNHAQEDK